MHADEWSTACLDWQERMLSGRPLIPDLPLYDEEADLALRWFKSLRVPDIAGFPTYGEVCRPWVFDFVRAIFGSYDRSAKRRMIREFFLLVPKKNGKSAIAAAIIVVACILNARPEAELLLIAPTKQIADISYKQAKGIIRLASKIQPIFRTKDHVREIHHQATGAVIIVKAADTDVITGGKATYTLVDETHVFSTKANASDVFVELRGALASRPEGFFLQISTQSKKPPHGVFKTELEIARAVRDGKIRQPMLPVLYELPPEIQKDEKWKNRAYWPLVNPNLGASVDPEFLSDELGKAEEAGAEQLALFASQHFNVQVGIGLGGWVGAKYWLGAADPEKITIEGMIERCEVIVAGIDGGGLDDLAGLSLAGRCATTGNWLFWHHAWVHPDALEQRKANLQHYEQFRIDGDLTFCEDPTQDAREIAEIIARVNDEGLLPEKYAVGLDSVGVAAIKDQLIAAELESDQLVAVPQGYRLSGVIKGFERRLKDGTLWHDGSALMTWCAGNAKPELSGSATLITKKSAGLAKIDPLIASFNAFELLSRHPIAKGTVPDAAAMIG